jgi:hypothetical protein
METFEVRAPFAAWIAVVTEVGRDEVSAKSTTPRAIEEERCE